jgi:hypothetical protein
MDMCIVPSIRQKQRLSSDALYCANDRWRDGGLEAHKGLCVMTEAVLPISPLYHYFSVEFLIFGSYS